MNDSNQTHTVKLNLKERKKYNFEKVVPMSEKVDKIIWKHFCVEVQTKYPMTFEEAPSIASTMIHNYGIALKSKEDRKLIAIKNNHDMLL